MLGDMKFEESSLTRYLVKSLQPLTEADPVLLANYVAALLKKDKPTKELQKLCAENLVEFLGQGTKSFIAKLFQALEDGTIEASTESLDAVKQLKKSPSFVQEDPLELKISSPKPVALSPSDRVSDSEEKEVSDDDDDDRNHKHRRRETQSQSFDRDVQEENLRRPNRKRNKPYENVQRFLESDPQSSETRKEYNLSPLEREMSAKFQKKPPGFAIFPRATSDLSQRTRVNQAFHGDPGPRFDLSTSIGRYPIGRGRGRGSGPWNLHDTRFSSVDALDFASQMALQGSGPPSLFAGRGLPNAASAQSASWSAFGLIPGVPNMAMDTRHPLGLQGTLRPPINPSLNMGIPRQRCRDFEERGFCLRGDMCPMEHGVNRIVVEDVQSLSQFNLPVSLPSARLLGTPAGTGPSPSVSAPSSVLTNSRGMHSKSIKLGKTDDGLGLEGVLSASAAMGEADFYDPDQPLWNKNCPETSTALLRLPSPKIEETEPIWGADPSDCHGIDSESSGRSIATAVGSWGTILSVWGRTGNSRNKLTGKINNTLTFTGLLQNESKDDQEVLNSIQGTVHLSKRNITEDVGPKVVNSSATPRTRSDHVRNIMRPSQKALRTLFVNGVPLKNNKREALLSHFQKFGEVIDIYIPLNSERAFVQFSRREEAEVALKAPDAVMGNRFIKLWWANRDNIPNDGICSGSNVYATPRGMAPASIPPQLSVANKGKENLPSAAPKVSVSPSNEVSVPATDHPKPVFKNGPEATPPLQKKLESLELLKEELRLKQEMLDQKRNDFRRQLDKLEKQAPVVKGEVAAEQAVKRHKVGTLTDIEKAATPSPTDPGTTGARPGAEKMVDKNNIEENNVSPKTNSAMVLLSLRSLKLPSRPSTPIGVPYPVNRFKLDNRPTAFRILPPLPAGFANVAVLKEHFSPYNDLSTVEVEVPETHTVTAGSEASENCSAHITFISRRSAERAFLNGKCWQGHTLQFMWLTTSSNSSSDHGGRENSLTHSPKGRPDAEVRVGTGISGSSSLRTGKSRCSVSQDTAATGNEEPENLEVINGGIEHVELVEASQSSPVTLSSCETQFPEADVC
ncbi:hypothetical protein HHK36_015620 [Tetracentron sinense]|uniref:Uncharacterized protein n=1 Tax=Tetracentron sinense TaxID=13715 RepID=A0A834Z2I1_TETSI|nr:hypothetical protein HHK36_015620 [Tetracentron sinense]